MNTSPTAAVTVVRASATERAEFERMLGEYRAELGLSGSYPYAELYWSERGRHPYHFALRGMSAGFAMVRELEDGMTHEIAEFFVSPTYRRSGIGRAAVERLLALHPGRWHVKAMAGSAVAKRFWERVPSDGLQVDHRCGETQDSWRFSSS